MGKNKTLSAAKSAKNDEFYTQYADIQKEINAYLDYDPDVFRGKTVLLPCDDPEWSNFTRFFAQNFETLGLNKLISTLVEGRRDGHFQLSDAVPYSQPCQGEQMTSSVVRSHFTASRVVMEPGRHAAAR